MSTTLKYWIITGICGFCLVLTGCNHRFMVYHVTVQQGNVITKQMRRQIYVGMRRYQVESILGSPILVDTFNNNRYNYVYTLQKKGRLVEKYKLTILFQDDKVIKIIDGH